jgi:CheY-like chemotaxis protein
MKTILYADDTQSVQEAITRVLYKIPEIKIQLASHGLEAWEKIQASYKAFDAIVTDNLMPYMTGVQLINKLREHEISKGYTHKPAFIISGDNPRNLVDQLNGWVIPVFEKPHQIFDLKKSVEEALYK